MCEGDRDPSDRATQVLMHEFRGRTSGCKYFSQCTQPFDIDGPLEDFGGMVIETRTEKLQLSFQCKEGPKHLIT
jgi:hypothetical protein